MSDVSFFRCDLTLVDNNIKENVITEHLVTNRFSLSEILMILLQTGRKFLPPFPIVLEQCALPQSTLLFSPPMRR